MVSRTAPPPASGSGYAGGALARQITSNELVPVESLIGRQGKDAPLQEESGERERRGTGGEEAEVEGRGERSGDTSPDGEKDEFNVVSEDGEGIADEWTFPDGGWKAWSVIFGCFLHSCNCQGYGMIWGVIVENLHRYHHPNTSLATLQLIVGLQNFGLNASPFITGRLGEIFGFRKMIAIGSTCSVIMLIISACVVDSLPALFVCQGILLGLAHGISLPLFMTIPSQWFSKRRGFATGITVSGTGFGGGFASLIVRGMLPSLGYRNTLLVYAGISAVVYFCGWFLLETRRPPLRTVAQKPATKTGLPPGIWKDPAFHSLLACVFFGVFGFLTPSYYLTTYTTVECPELDQNSLAPAVPLLVSNFTLGIGRLFCGLLADYFGPVNCLFFSFFTGGILQLAFWSNATTYGAIIAFGALYQLFGGWFFALMPYAAAQLFGLEGLATITGYIVTGQSPGQLAGASISGVVLDSTGQNYKAVAYYAGAVMVTGALCILPARFLRQRKLLARI